ncbi:hypothetical protein OIE68_20605 [Nocardia vinacea]|uniref:hypothetical protein n=1 Tax=Nocardia vinacea TaxID=96468 RepID=UPI002E12EB73|nr:hypothetical protein OIE68_20605 [Nocardia vinacea]
MEVPRTISRRNALEAGFTGRELSRRPWQRVCRGQYLSAVDIGEMTTEQRHLVLTDAVAAGSSSAAVVSHISAAVVHGLPVWSIPLARVHLTRNRRTGARTGKRVMMHAASIESDEVVQIGDLRVTTVARTIVDLARTVPFEQAVVVGDAALRLGHTSSAELAEQLLRANGRPGCPAARRVIDFLDGRAESPGESRSRVVLCTAGLPAPELQSTVLDVNGGFVARVDFLFPTLGVIGEFDGMIKYRNNFRHGSSESTVIAEKLSADALRALGWAVVRWTWPDLDTPDRWLTRLARAAAFAHRIHRAGTWRPTERE